MNNPKDQITSYLNSLDRKFSVEGNTIKVEDASIEIQPSIGAAESSRVTMRIAHKFNPTGVHNSSLMIVLLSTMMSSEFQIDSFLEGLNDTDGAISTVHDGISVSVDPTSSFWVIDFSPA